MNHETLPAQGPVDVTVSRQCTCHPDDNPPQPCEHRYAFRDCADAAEERYLREMLAILQESYAKAAKPYMDRLVALHSRSLPQMTSPIYNICTRCGRKGHCAASCKEPTR